MLTSSNRRRLSDSVEINWSDEAQNLRELAKNAARVTGRSAFQGWKQWYLVPLYSTRANGSDDSIALIGMLGIKTTDNPVSIVDENDTNLLYTTYIARAEQTLDDILLQNEIYAALEGLLPQLTITRRRDDLIEYRPGREPMQSHQIPDDEELYEQVRAALRHYWGGPGITRSRLIEFAIVQDAMTDAEDRRYRHCEMCFKWHWNAYVPKQSVH